MTEFERRPTESGAELPKLPSERPSSMPGAVPLSRPTARQASESADDQATPAIPRTEPLAARLRSRGFSLIPGVLDAADRIADVPGHRNLPSEVIGQVLRSGDVHEPTDPAHMDQSTSADSKAPGPIAGAPWIAGPGGAAGAAPMDGQETCDISSCLGKAPTYSESLQEVTHHTDFCDDALTEAQLDWVLQLNLSSVADAEFFKSVVRLADAQNARRKWYFVHLLRGTGTLTWYTIDYACHPSCCRRWTLKFDFFEVRYAGNCDRKEASQARRYYSVPREQPQRFVAGEPAFATECT